jgi:hypothetical protein
MSAAVSIEPTKSGLPTGAGLSRQSMLRKQRWTRCLASLLRIATRWFRGRRGGRMQLAFAVVAVPAASVSQAADAPRPATGAPAPALVPFSGSGPGPFSPPVPAVTRSAKGKVVLGRKFP